MIILNIVLCFDELCTNTRPQGCMHVVFILQMKRNRGWGEVICPWLVRNRVGIAVCVFLTPALLILELAVAQQVLTSLRLQKTLSFSPVTPTIRCWGERQAKLWVHEQAIARSFDISWDLKLLLGGGGVGGGEDLLTNGANFKEWFLQAKQQL